MGDIARFAEHGPGFFTSDAGISIRLLRVPLAQLVVLRVGHDVLYVDPPVPEIDKGNQPQVVTADIDYPTNDPCI